MQNKSYKYSYYIITLLFLAINVFWILRINTKPFSDFGYYDALAKQIALGGSWGDTYTSVGYPIFLAFFYKLFGSKIIVAKIVNIILSLLSVMLFKKILDSTNLNEKGKIIVFALFTFFPSTIFYNSILGSEILFTFLILLVTYLYFNIKVKLKYVYIGILVGILTMVKPFFILFFFAIFLIEIIFEGNIIATIKNSLVILIISFIVISPWLYRNTKLNGQFTYVSNNSGIVLYINNNSQNTKGRWMAATDVENSIVNTEDYKTSNMTVRNKMLSKEAKKWIKSHPKDFFVLGFKRLGSTYIPPDDILYSFNETNLSQYAQFKCMGVYGVIRLIIFVPAILYILIYSLYCIINLFRKKIYNLDKFKVYICILFYMFTVIYFVTEGQARYAFPLSFSFCYMFWELVCTIVNKKENRI